jgi:hypothetical protein
MKSQIKTQTHLHSNIHFTYSHNVDDKFAVDEMSVHKMTFEQNDNTLCGMSKTGV